MSSQKKQANPNDIEITSIDIEEGKEYRFLLPRDGGKTLEEACKAFEEDRMKVYKFPARRKR